MTEDEKFLEAIKKFREAAEHLTEVWFDHTDSHYIGIEDYPKGLPPFDDFLIQVKKWHQTQKTIINQLTIF